MKTNSILVILSKIALAVCVLGVFILPEIFILWAFLAVIPLAVIIDEFLKGRL